MFPDVVTILFQGLSSTVLFASRPFLTGFVIAAVARVGYEAFVRPAETARLLGADQGATAALTFFNFAAESWLISDVALTIFAVLAIAEVAALFSEEGRHWHGELAGMFQLGAAGAVNFSLVDGQAAQLMGLMLAGLPATLASAVSLVDAHALAQTGGLLAWVGHALALLWAGLTAGAAWVVGAMRGALVGALAELDEDDTLGIQTGLAWLENVWVVAGVLFLVVLPALALILFGLTALGLYLARRSFEARERKTLLACAACGASMHPSAPFCPSCRAANPQPRQVGLFGQAKAAPAADPALHRVQLVARKRCPVCATRLKERAPQQACSACGTLTFADISQVNTFLRAIDRRLPQTMAVSFAFGLIPLIGLVPGIAYYRLSLVASLRGYIPRNIGCLARWGVRLLNLVLIAFQPVPLIGAFLLPLMCALNYAVYRQVVYGSATARLARAFERPAVAPAPGAVALPAPAGPADTRTCPSCGARASPGYRFCTHCGSPVEA